MNNVWLQVRFTWLATWWRMSRWMMMCDKIWTMCDYRYCPPDWLPGGGWAGEWWCVIWYELCVITGTVHLTGYLVEDEQVNDDVWYDMNYVWLQVLFTWLATWWRMSRWMMMCDMIWTMCDYRYCSPDWLPGGGWAGEWWCVIWYELCVITGTVHLTGYLVEDEQVNDDVWYDMNYVWLQVLFTWLATWWRMSRWMMMCDMIWTMCDYRYCSPDWLPGGGWAGEWWCVIWYELCVITGTVHLTGYLVEDEQVNDDVWYDMNYVWLQVLFTWLATWWRMSRWMMMCDMIWTMCDYRYGSPDWLPGGGWAGEWWCVIWYEQCVITGTVHLTGYLVEDEQVNDDVWYDMNNVWLQVRFTWLATWWRMSRWMMMCDMQCLSQDLETGCLKLSVVKFLGVQIFKGNHNILIFQP